MSTGGGSRREAEGLTWEERREGMTGAGCWEGGVHKVELWPLAEEGGEAVGHVWWMWMGVISMLSPESRDVSERERKPLVMLLLVLPEGTCPVECRTGDIEVSKTESVSSSSFSADPTGWLLQVVIGGEGERLSLGVYGLAVKRV